MGRLAQLKKKYIKKKNCEIFHIFWKIDTTCAGKTTTSLMIEPIQKGLRRNSSLEFKMANRIFLNLISEFLILLPFDARNINGIHIYFVIIKSLPSTYVFKAQRKSSFFFYEKHRIQLINNFINFHQILLNRKSVNNLPIISLSFFYVDMYEMILYG